ncbi:MAG: leucine-rich repeat protein, partial [Christensenellales bacterium]
GAFDGYAQYINAITIPLNLYFLEEGAFRDCLVTTFARTPEKSGETKLDYVVIDNDRAIYQKDECPYAAITGRGSGYVFKAAESNTVVGYTADYSEGTEYTLLAGTERIGAYAFANATYLTALRGTESVVGIGKQAFRNAAELVTFGATDGKITLNKEIAYVGEEAFAQCTKINAVEVESGSVLAFIGKNAFYRTNWYDAKKGIKVIRFTDDDGRETGIILGYYSGSLGSDYDKDKAYDADGNESATGEYFGIKADGATLLMTSGGSVAYVIIDFEVKFICDGAFDGLNAQKYTFNKGVKEIGDRAFAGHAALEEIVFKEAFGTEGTNLGDEVFYGRGTAITVRSGSEAVKNIITSGLNWNTYSEILLLII